MANDTITIDVTHLIPRFSVFSYRTRVHDYVATDNDDLNYLYILDRNGKPFNLYTREYNQPWVYIFTQVVDIVLYEKTISHKLINLSKFKKIQDLYDAIVFSDGVYIFVSVNNVFGNNSPFVLQIIKKLLNTYYTVNKENEMWEPVNNIHTNILAYKNLDHYVIPLPKEFD